MCTREWVGWGRGSASNLCWEPSLRINDGVVLEGPCAEHRLSLAQAGALGSSQNA